MFKLDPEVLAAGGQNLAPQRAYWKPLIAANASVIVVLFTLTKWWFTFSYFIPVLGALPVQFVQRIYFWNKCFVVQKKNSWKLGKHPNFLPNLEVHSWRPKRCFIRKTASLFLVRLGLETIPDSVQRLPLGCPEPARSESFKIYLKFIEAH